MPSIGYAPIRRGLMEHIELGKFSPYDIGIYLMIQIQVNPETGIWIGSSQKLAALCPRANEREIRRSLECLEQHNFIKRFKKPGGMKGNYVVLIHKYFVQIGALTGSWLNAIETKDWLTPKYEYGEEVAVKEAKSSKKQRNSASKIFREEIQEKELKTLSSPPATEFEHPLAKIWKEEHGKLPDIQAMSRERLAKCSARMKSHASDPERFLADFRKAVSLAQESPFLCGTGGGWKASFDWFVENDKNYLKVIEGNYFGKGKEVSAPREAHAGTGPERGSARARPEVLQRFAALAEKSPNYEGG